jgi:hypothetical protein
MSKKSNSGGMTIPDFKLYRRVIVTKAAWYWPKKKHQDPWNTLGDPEINPYNQSLLIFNKGDKNIPWRKEVSSTNGVGKTDYLHVEQNPISHYKSQFKMDQTT